LKGVISQYGPCATFHAGLFALGFPGTWVTNETEAAEIEMFLGGDAARRNYFSRLADD
jgi:hypothetical protein